MLFYSTPPGKKLATNIFASWLQSDPQSSLVVSDTGSSQKRICTQQEVMTSARSQSIQGAGPLGLCSDPLTENTSVTHFLHLTLCSPSLEDRSSSEQCCALSHLYGGKAPFFHSVVLLKQFCVLQSPASKVVLLSKLYQLTLFFYSKNLNPFECT